ncbi:MAG: hypothetical protein JWN52_4771 [Actinomycetia bacterium]|nr:hypothetical protein [Actinomycetes bacterium]
MMEGAKLASYAKFEIYLARLADLILHESDGGYKCPRWECYWDEYPCK